MEDDAVTLDAILPLGEVTEIVDLSPRTIYYEIKEGRFPRQVQLSKRRVGWTTSSIRSWLSERGRAA